MANIGELIKPALIAGLGVGIIGSIFSNGMGFLVTLIPPLACCLGLPMMALCIVWPSLTGVGTVMLASKKHGLGIADGAIGGALAGVFGGLASTVIGFLFFILQTVFNIGTTMATSGVDGDSLAMIGLGGIGAFAGFIFGSFFSVIVWTGISAVAGLVGAMIFGNK
ncbi:hypothetical protein ACFLRF_06340 [Candidatus Altiarchaeota archaeon]